MASENFSSRWHGLWRGDYRLFMDPTQPSEDSKTEMRIAPSMAGAFLRIEYTWSMGGRPKEGLFVVGGGKTVWVDTMHTHPEPMVCTESLEADAITLMGQYGAGDEIWKWRTELRLDGDTLTMKAINIDPSGTGYPAVDATLKRAET